MFDKKNMFAKHRNMEEHLADMRRVQKAKLSRADNRAMELQDLRPEQGNQMMEPMEGAGACSGGAAGLARVVGSGKKKKAVVMAEPEMKGGFWGALASLAVPLIGKLFGQGAMNEEAHKKLMALMKKRKVGEHTKLSGGFWGALASLAVPLIGKLFGKGAMTKEANDELMKVFKKDAKADMKGGAMYADPAFGVVNETLPPTIASMAGAGVYGGMLRAHLMKLKGEGFVRDFAHGFNGKAVPSPHTRAGGPQLSLGMKMNEALIDKSVGKGATGAGPFSPMALKMLLPRKEAGIVEGGMKGKCPDCGYAKCRCGAGRAGAGATGAGMDARKARGQAVSKLMKEKGMSLGEASKYVKEHGF